MITKDKNAKELYSLCDYCLQHPEERFWQALRNWSFQYYKDEFPDGTKPEIHYIFAGFDQEACEDTFYWE